MTDSTAAAKGGHSLAAISAQAMAQPSQPSSGRYDMPSQPSHLDSGGYDTYSEPSGYGTPTQPSYYDEPSAHMPPAADYYERPLQPGPVVLPDLPPSRPHEFPFDVVPAKKPDHTGFPFAIPEDPRPEPGSSKPIIMAAIVAAIVMLIVVVASMLAPLPTPMHAAREYQAELDDINREISAFVSTQALFVLQQERENMYRDLSAIRWGIAHTRDRMVRVREFYLYPPALIVIPEIIVESGLGGIETIESRGNLVILGIAHAHEMPALGRAFLALRRSEIEMFGTSTLSERIDGGDHYRITVSPSPGYSPFWMHSSVERRWP